MVTAEELGYDPKIVRVAEGRYREIMPKLRTEGFAVKTPLDIIDDRNESIGKQYQNTRWNNYFLTSMGVSGTNRDVIFTPEILLNVTPKTKLTDGGIALPKNYNGKIIRVSREEIGPLNRLLTEKEALEHRGWQILAGDNQDRLAKYVENAFRLRKDQFGYDEMMGLYVSNDGNVRALGLDRTDLRAIAYVLNLGLIDARLVGVSAEQSERREGTSVTVRSSVGAQKSSSGDLERIIKEFDITDPKELRKALELYQAAKRLTK